MANPERGEADLTLGGQSFRLKFGIGALIVAQEQLRQHDPEGRTPSVQEIQDELRKGRLLYLRAMVYAGLQKHHANYSVEKVDELLESVTEQEARALLKAFGFAVTPDKDDLKELGVDPNKSQGSKNPQRAQTTRRRSGGDSISKRVA